MSDELIGPSGAGHNTSDDIQELLDYLRVARDLETGLMKLSEIEKHALSEISSIEHRVYPEFVPPNPHPEQESDRTSSKAWHTGAFIGAVCGVIFEFCLDWHTVGQSNNSLYWLGSYIAFFMAAAICAAIGAAIGAFIGLLIGSSIGGSARASLEDENREAKRAWEEEIEQEKERDASAVLQFKEDTAILTDMKNAVKKMLEEHYSNGPLYQKYRTLPAICQLYEYFDSGRFTELGAAYNQYELEVRLDRLIDNSEKALQVLYQIRDNQHILFDALLSVRDSVYAINGSIDKCAQNLDYIAYSQEISSLCLQQTAVASTLLSQIEYYKNRHNLPMLLHGYEGYLLGINARVASRKRRLAR